MKTPISDKLFSDWRIATDNAAALSGKIEERITYILQRLVSIFGGPLDYWYFDGAEEGEVGDLSNRIASTHIYELITEYKQNPVCGRHGMIIIDKFGKEYSCNCEIPTRWLFEDFEEEIINGKKLYEAREAEKKIKKKADLEKKMVEYQSLAATAKKKLSKEELEALRRTL